MCIYMHPRVAARELVLQICVYAYTCKKRISKSMSEHMHIFVYNIHIRAERERERETP